MALGPLHLADKSAWEQARYDKRARQRLHELRDAGQLAVCIVSMAELLYAARNADEHVADVMAALALRGQHRTPIPDLMLAAIAHAHSAVVLHYDSDYERIADVTGQSHEWIVPRATGHRGSPS